MFVILKEGLRIFKRNIKVKLFGLEKFSGTDEEICRKIIDACWNGKYFSTTPKGGNYGFYSRDFGWCIQSLINLGYKNEVNKTLEYALKIFEKNKGIYVSISPSGIPFNFPNIYSPDSVAYIFRSIRINKNKKIIEKYRSFLNFEAKKFRNICIDNKGIINQKHFSGMRDYAIIKGSCYDMIMACLLEDEINKINEYFGREILINPFKNIDLKNNLINNFWNGKYFQELNKNILYGHNNVYPYFLDIVKDKKMLLSSITHIKKAKLDMPIPLKYESNMDKSNYGDKYYKNDKTKFIWQELFVKDWEKRTSWSMLGMAYIYILARVDKKKAKKHLKEYKSLIEKYGFVEVYDNLKPYQSFFYTSETRMLWASMYLELKNLTY
ncbi:MAG: hypothetical protein QXK76_01720 [Candidatus Woesearchaeota archaeon]